MLLCADTELQVVQFSRGKAHVPGAVTGGGALGSVLPHADSAAARTLLLPMHQSLSDADVERVVDAVGDSVRARTGRSAAHGRRM